MKGIMGLSGTLKFLLENSMALPLAGTATPLYEAFIGRELPESKHFPAEFRPAGAAERISQTPNSSIVGGWVSAPFHKAEQPLWAGVGHANSELKLTLAPIHKTYRPNKIFLREFSTMAFDAPDAAR
jgi:hypothetical protein